ncbi:uncharacterized protein CLUP02_04039 [Colletotrichum lupini]|uniref:Uncharacterized protein n=1 Tax=Colletotrichum lupini TaxID=145971 RepID=A0A9Q8WDB2_9PEZI|nr:uncharacterized protein CLUP02_04039 [Colletotrichum lupini]UQC78562.1 hypothetical protein CLUP02_04039 [Colletotrichum lupini]
MDSGINNISSNLEVCGDYRLNLSRLDGAASGGQHDAGQVTYVPTHTRTLLEYNSAALKDTLSLRPPLRRHADAPQLTEPRASLCSVSHSLMLVSIVEIEILLSFSSLSFASAAARSLPSYLCCATRATLVHDRRPPRPIRAKRLTN